VLERKLGILGFLIIPRRRFIFQAAQDLPPCGSWLLQGRWRSPLNAPPGCGALALLPSSVTEAVQLQLSGLQAFQCATSTAVQSGRASGPLAQCNAFNKRDRGQFLPGASPPLPRRGLPFASAVYFAPSTRAMRQGWGCRGHSQGRSDVRGVGVVHRRPDGRGLRSGPQGCFGLPRALLSPDEGLCGKRAGARGCAGPGRLPSARPPARRHNRLLVDFWPGLKK
jgi:hypothetical protein